MAKIALLIGISEYRKSEYLKFENLPYTLKDVEAMERVLGNPEMGGFDDIKVLQNSNRQQIEEAIYKLFANRNQDDLLLFYFSGHGIVNAEGHLFLATSETDKDQQGYVPFTVVAARYLQTSMNESFSEHLVVILDCCYSGAFINGTKSEEYENINIQKELGGKGRAILMSCSSTQRSFHSEVSELSIYTKYLVEGIKTGAADTDKDGKISADELHQYVSEKVPQEDPKMTPQFEPVQEGYRIFLASYPKDDPKLKYRRQVQKTLQENDGKINPIDRYTLNESCRNIYGISDEEAKAIETDEMNPYIQRQEKLKRYEEMFSQAVEELYPFTEQQREKLQQAKLVSGLKDEDVADIEKKILDRRLEPEPQTSIQNDEIEIELLSDKNIDYTKLRDFLANGEWKKADMETVLCILKVVGKKKQEDIRLEDIENFPCKDLRTIDQLWVKHSDSNFGFSVQNEIYQSLGGTKEYNKEVWEKFGEKVGWKKGDKWLSDNELNYPPDTSLHYRGQLPRRFALNVVGKHLIQMGVLREVWGTLVRYLFSRANNCGL